MLNKDGSRFIGMIDIIDLVTVTTENLQKLESGARAAWKELTQTPQVSVTCMRAWNFPCDSDDDDQRSRLWVISWMHQEGIRFGWSHPIKAC